MSELIEVDYTSLVKEVYIDPIRTVVVVDDDFPTMDELLDSAHVSTVNTDKPDAAWNSEAREKQKEQAAGDGGAPVSSPVRAAQRQVVEMRFDGQIGEVERVKELISVCRGRARPWMVDVHDGRPETGMNELVLAPSLHHSDLMILDYHLTGDDGDGERAIQILKKLAENDQFNLVIVYTKGISGDIQNVYQQIAVALAHREWIPPYSPAKNRATRSLILDWEDEIEGASVEKNLMSFLSVTKYLEVRSSRVRLEESGLNDLFAGFLQGCPDELRIKDVEYVHEDGKKANTRLSEKSLFEYAIQLRHLETLHQMSECDYGNIACDFTAERNWIRLDRVFITVVNKLTEAPNRLEACLVDALMKWAPGPHQLLMARMRTKLSEKGVGAEGSVLANRPLQAGWLHEMLNSNGDAESVMTQSINRHWEALGDRLYGDVKAYARNIFDYFRGADRATVLAKYMPLGIDDVQKLTHLNYYYSTKPVDSPHLTTGQVFEFTYPEGAGEPVRKEYWICLSPACDLVPGQKKNGWKMRLGQAMPFIAVQLESANPSDALKNVNQNRFVFAQLDNAIKAFKFTSDSQSTSLPVWEQMFAPHGGSFDGELQNGRRSLLVQRMRDDGGNLAFDAVRATIICQLRYEYALNLLQRLANALSRVGLDFRNL
ncbi:response regulator receiver domain [Paraburkholderia sp. EG287B]|uniref:response regulator receiver domain n=1 Tax=Paraburkholderia sp. EG287B TaxID=3237010 RepID=UPI0034D33357